MNYEIGAQTGIGLIREAVSSGYPAPILLLSGRGHCEADVQGLRAGAKDYLHKDELNASFLERSIRYAIERNQMEKELDRRMQDRLEILASIQDGFFAIDQDWQITYINHKAAQNMLMTEEELLGKNILEAFPKLKNTALEKNYRKVMTERAPMQFEARGVYNGIWYLISVYPAAEGISIYWQDITERKQVEENLRVSEERFNKAFNAVPNALLITRKADGLIQDVNDSFEKLFGYPRAEVIGRTTLELNLFAHPTDRDKAMEQLRTAQSLRAFEGDFRTKTGAIRQASVSVEALTIGGEEYLLAIVEDITERKQAEDELRRSEASIRQLNEELLQRNRDLDTERARWKEIIEGIADEVWVCDAQGNMGLMNLAAVTAMGLEEFQDWPVEKVLAEVEISYPNGQLRPPDQSPLLLSLKGEIVRGEEIMRHRRTGVIRNRQYSSAPTRDTAGRITGAVAVVQDITHLKQTEAELRESEAHLRQSEEKYRTLFTSVQEGFTLNQAIYDQSGELVDLLVLEANPAAEVANGLNRDDLVGKAWRQLWPGAEQYWWDVCSSVFQTGKQMTYENYAKEHDRWYEVHHFRAGKDLMGSLFLDVTERKQAEKALEKVLSEVKNDKNRLLAIMEALPIGVVILDAQGGIVQANQEYERVWGGSYPTTRSVADYGAFKAWWVDTGAPVQSEEWASALAVQKGEIVKGQLVEIQRFDGTRGVVLNSGAPIFDAQGQIIGCAVGVMDITEQKRLEVEQQEQHLQMEIQRRLLDYCSFAKSSE